MYGRYNKNKKRQRRVIISQYVYRESKVLFPDFIEGKWTEENANPVKFEYTYNGWNKTIDWLQKKTEEWMEPAIKSWWTGVQGAVLVASIATAMAASITSMVLDALFAGGAIASTIALLPILPIILSIGGLALLKVIEDMENKGFIEPGKKYEDAVKRAKDVVDNTWGWHVDSYDPYIQHRVHKYKSAKITMTAQYDKVITTYENKIVKIRGRKYNEYNVASDPVESGISHQVYEGLTEVSTPVITYTKNPEWDHD